TTHDLVFASEGLTDRLVKCSTLPGHGSDHIAIRVTFDVTVIHREIPLRRNFRDADWKEFPACLKAHLARRPLPELPIASRADLDTYTAALAVSLVDALKDHVPLLR
ncbi:hypothetical protein DFH08DRAFT_620283, partial [Mycena albidolilacea]